MLLSRHVQGLRQRLISFSSFCLLQYLNKLVLHLLCVLVAAEMLTFGFTIDALY